VAKPLEAVILAASNDLPQDAELHPRERETLLILFAGSLDMATKGRGLPRHKLVSELGSELHLQGQHRSENTIRKFIDMAYAAAGSQD
jgi:hypothetical protein